MEEQITIFDDIINQMPNSWMDLYAAAPTEIVQNAFGTHFKKFHVYERIMVSVSGGSDSDILIDMIERMGYEKGTVVYVFFNTGIEYQATKDHLDYLEERYGIKIERIPAKMPTTVACKKYGVPFLSKMISENIHRLQLHNFKWEDKPFEELLKEYPNCKSALKWYCNRWGEKSQKNIKRRFGLKEFLIANPPPIPISPMCCQKSKKDTAHEYAEQFNPDLDVQGVRKSEGGQRATAYTSCFDKCFDGCDKLRLIYWFTDKDKKAYNSTFKIKNSRCYTVYGLIRTGCACCPFGKYFEHELEAAKKYEPNLYLVAMATFGASYEYTRKYIKFRDELKQKKKEVTNEQIHISNNFNRS